MASLRGFLGVDQVIDGAAQRLGDSGGDRERRGALSGFIHAQSALRNTNESGEFTLGHLFCFSEFGNTLRDNHLLDLFGIVIISQRVIKCK